MENIGEHINWTTRQKGIVALAALAIVFDGVDNQVLGFATPALITEWGVTKAEMSPVSAAGLVGMVIGAIWAGTLGDRYGRRNLLVASMILFGGMTMVAALADGLTWLGIARFAAGLGLGGALPNATAYAAAFTPIRHRPIAITLTIVCMPLGGMIAGVLARMILPEMGWRTLLTISGMIPLLLAIPLFLVLPESTPEGKIHDDISTRDLVSPKFRHDSITLWIAMFCCLMAVYSVNSWAPTMLNEAGFSATTATDGLSGFNLGGIAGGIVAAWLIMRKGSRKPLLLISLIAVGAILVTGLWVIGSQNSAMIVAAFLTIGFCVHGVQTTLFAVCSHAYPDSIRATGVGVAVGIGRMGAVLSAFVGAVVLSKGGGVAFFGLIGLAMVGVFGALFVLSKHIPASAAVKAQPFSKP